GVGEDFWPAAYDPKVPDEIIAVSDADSFDMTRRLAREEALLVGGSCGMAVVAAVEAAVKAGPDALVVVLLPDGGRGYMSKLFNDSWMSSYGFLRSRLDGSTVQPTVADVLRAKSGVLPDLVHTHPSETLRDAIGILREYGVSQMPVVGAEPPVMAGEVAGSVSERDLLSAVFEGRAKLADAVSQHMGPPLPLIGSGEVVDVAATALAEVDAVMVVEDGKPVGVITRHDLLGFLSDGPRRR
ncbi:pyridoxal-phosphate dependent enzyme, partial [Mycolicibacter sinensis]|uniref:pyridoxal-phosphate dependent enzyme n=1 Tax=Mycolicibacter sinensis (strain JDM601) TaxID=875328 RepID=UPI000B2E4612